MPDQTGQMLSLHELLKEGPVVLYFYPKDFTPVCTTELGSVARAMPEFPRRGVKVIGLRVDSLDSHRRWRGDIEETQSVTLNYPPIADD